MAPRSVRNWLRAYLEWTRETESPDIYHFFTAATIIGAMTKRQVHLEMNYFRIYPNLYTIIVGPSGARKSVAVSLGMRLANEAGIRKFSDKITGAALIRDLATGSEKRIDPNLRDISLCSPVIIYSSELGVFMGPDAYGSGVIADLTDLYDCPSKWSKKTIARDEETVIAPYVSLLAATTPQTLRDVIPQGAVGQGFTSRILFVWASGRRTKAPIPAWGSEHVMLERYLTNDLRTISGLRGTFSFSPAGLELYKQHYLNRPEPEDEFEDERLRGYASRKDIHTLKLAMVLSLADKDELILTERDMAGAIEAIEWLDSGLPNVFASHGSSASVEDATRVFRQVDTATRRVGYIAHRELMKRNYYYLNSSEMEIVTKTLIEAGAIQEVIGRNAGTGAMEKFYKSIDPEFLSKIKVRFPNQLKEKDED
jgi:hypothetical protein